MKNHWFGCQILHKKQCQLYLNIIKICLKINQQIVKNQSKTDQNCTKNLYSGALGDVLRAILALKSNLIRKTQKRDLVDPPPDPKLRPTILFYVKKLSKSRKCSIVWQGIGMSHPDLEKGTSSTPPGPQVDAQNLTLCLKIVLRWVR